MKSFLYTLLFLTTLNQVNAQMKFGGECLTKDKKPIAGNIIFPLINKSIPTDSLGYFSFGATEEYRIFYVRTRDGSISRIIDVFDYFIKPKKKQFFIKLVIPEEAFYEPYHKNKECPLCKHGGSIIPILYGYPNKEAMEKATKGSIKLGGCEKSSAQWYCKIHRFEF